MSAKMPRVNARKVVGPRWPSWEERRAADNAKALAQIPHAPDLSTLDHPETSAPYFDAGVWAYGRKVQMRRDVLWTAHAQSMATAADLRERAAKLRERLEGAEGEDIAEKGMFGKAELRYLLAEMDKSADAAEAFGCAMRQAVMGHCEHTHFHGMDSCPHAIIVEGEADLGLQFTNHERHLKVGLLFPEQCKQCAALIEE
jgi:hypothetical protein